MAELKKVWAEAQICKNDDGRWVGVITHSPSDKHPAIVSYACDEVTDVLDWIINRLPTATDPTFSVSWTFTPKGETKVKGAKKKKK